MARRPPDARGETGRWAGVHMPPVSNQMCAEHRKSKMSGASVYGAEQKRVFWRNLGVKRAREVGDARSWWFSPLPQPAPTILGFAPTLSSREREAHPV